MKHNTILYIVIGLLAIGSLVLLGLYLSARATRPPAVSTSTSTRLWTTLDPATDAGAPLPLFGMNLEAWYQLQKPTRYGAELAVLDPQNSLVTSARVSFLSANGTGVTADGQQVLLLFPEAGAKTKVTFDGGSRFVGSRGLLLLVDDVQGSPVSFNPNVYSVRGASSIIVPQYPAELDATDIKATMPWFMQFLYGQGPASGLAQNQTEYADLRSHGISTMVVSSWNAPPNWVTVSRNDKNEETRVLNDGFELDLAAFYVGQLQFYEAHGMTFEYIEPINEVDGDWATHITPAQYATFTAHLRTLLDRSKLRTRILGPGSAFSNCKLSPSYSTVLTYAREPEFAANADGISTHVWDQVCQPGSLPGYIASAISNLSAIRTAYMPGKLLAITEYGYNLPELLPRPDVFASNFVYEHHPNGRSYCSNDGGALELPNAMDLDPVYAVYIYALTLTLLGSEADMCFFWQLADVGGLFGKELDYAPYGTNNGFGLFDRQSRLKPAGVLIQTLCRYLPLPSAARRRLVPPTQVDNAPLLIVTDSQSVCLTRAQYTPTIGGGIAAQYDDNIAAYSENATLRQYSSTFAGRWHVRRVAWYVVENTGLNPKQAGFKKTNNHGRLFEVAMPPANFFTPFKVNGSALQLVVEHQSSSTVISYTLCASCVIFARLEMLQVSEALPTTLQDKSHCELVPHDFNCAGGQYAKYCARLGQDADWQMLILPKGMLLSDAVKRSVRIKPVSEKPSEFLVTSKDQVSMKITVEQDGTLRLRSMQNDVVATSTSGAAVKYVRMPMDCDVCQDDCQAYAALQFLSVPTDAANCTVGQVVSGSCVVPAPTGKVPANGFQRWSGAYDAYYDQKGAFDVCQQYTPGCTGVDWDAEANVSYGFYDSTTDWSVLKKGREGVTAYQLGKPKKPPVLQILFVSTDSITANAAEDKPAAC